MDLDDDELQLTKMLNGTLKNKKISKIIKIFDELKIDIRLRGYSEWIALVQLFYEEKNIDLHNLKIEALYMKLSRKLGITRDGLERNLRTVVKKHNENIKKFFKYDYYITNKTFLILLLKYLK